MIWIDFACYMLGVVLVGVAYAWEAGDEDGEWWLLPVAYGWPIIVVFLVTVSIAALPIHFGLWLGAASMAKPKPEPRQ